MNDTATIFYNDEMYMSERANCFDVRHNASIIPRGSVVVGFMKSNGSHVEEILDPPCMTEQQKTNWIDVLDRARASISK